jgi:hypothetical protein
MRSDIVSALETAGFVLAIVGTLILWGQYRVLTARLAGCELRTLAELACGEANDDMESVIGELTRAQAGR